MNYEPINPLYEAENSSRESLGSYTAKTYLWMCAGLLLTAVIAVLGFFTGASLYVFTIPGGFFILGALEVATVLWLSARVNKMSVNTARGLFLFYAALNGIFFSTCLWIYGSAMLILIFVATSLFFGLMAAVSYFGKIDISGLKPVLLGGLVFLILFGVLSMFFRLEAMETIMCYVGIIVFLGFTAYDTGKIRQNYTYFSGNQELLEKASIFSALALYLDFINLFLYLLRLFSRSRN